MYVVLCLHFIHECSYIFVFLLCAQDPDDPTTFPGNQVVSYASDVLLNRLSQHTTQLKHHRPTCGPHYHKDITACLLPDRHASS